ncbi:MAG: hypothetical protein H0W68_04450 [Gemmatimonadaceae bacterium]|nr:hypothetical protein [Gemmatimonadaceae bacterium]
MSRKGRVLDEKFGGSEQRFQSFVRSDRQCRRAVLQAAGLDAGDAEIVEFRPRYYGSPDFFVRLADGRCAIIELCFDLAARHAFKDFSYALDPASEDVAALVWLCDSVPSHVVNMVRHYATRFSLNRRITLEILVPQAGRFDAEPPLRFAFDPVLRDLRAGAPRSSHDGATVLEQLTEQYRIADEIDTVTVARLFGTTTTWVTLHAVKPKKDRAPRLVCKQAPSGARLRGANNRLLFDLEDVSTFVSEFERVVTNVEAPHLGGATLPLVSATDPRIGTAWNTLEMFRSNTATRQYGAVKRALGAPVAFHISTAGRGYSALWPLERRSALRPLAANDNLPVTMLASGGVNR